LGYTFAEGDDFHPQANIDKMSAGAPLDDEDRMPWLRRLAQWTRARDDEGTSTVVTCSALRRRYRDVLRSGAADTFFVHLVGDQRVLLERMGRRQHFMPPALLKSQFDTLEPLGEDEHGLSLDVTESPERIVQQVVQSLRLRPRRPSGVDGQ
ncbi:MAG: gluconokinase, partial [Nocardioidaceae bacterium]